MDTCEWADLVYQWRTDHAHEFTRSWEMEGGQGELLADSSGAAWNYAIRLPSAQPSTQEALDRERER